MNKKNTEIEKQKPILSVDSLKVHFFTDEGTVKAVEGASFDVLPGRTLGIVGESGCGKSVATRSILRLVDSPGEIVDGEIIYRGDTNKKEINITSLKTSGPDIKSIRGGEISLIFQEPMTSFSPVHTVGNQIIEAIKLHKKLNKNDATGLTLDWFKRVGMPDPEQRMNQYPWQLSGGQRQRAMIAMALCCDPKIVIADEPTTALDVTTKAQILDLLKELQEENGMSIIFITHDLGVIAEISDDVSVMYLGNIVESASVDEIFHSPKHPYTTGLLNSIPAITNKNRERLPTISGSIPHPHNRPSGCTFRNRCPNPSDDCRDGNIEMKLIEVSPGHFVDQCCITCG